MWELAYHTFEDKKRIPKLYIAASYGTYLPAIDRLPRLAGSPHHLTRCAGLLANFVLSTGNPILLDHQFLTHRQLFLMALNGQSDCQHVTAGGRMTAAFARSTNQVGQVGPAALVGSDRMALRGIAPTTTRWAPAVTIWEPTIPETRGTPTVQLATAAARGCCPTGRNLGPDGRHKE